MVCRTKSQFKALTGHCPLHKSILPSNQGREFLSVIDHLETEEDEGKVRERTDTQ